MGHAAPTRKTSIQAQSCRDVGELRDRLAAAGASTVFSAAPAIARAILPGCQIWAFEVSREAGTTALAGLARSGRRSGGLLVAGAAAALDRDVLGALRAFSRENGLPAVKLEALDGAAPPSVYRESSRQPGTTYVVDLTEIDPDRVPSKNHRRNVKRARGAGVGRIAFAADEAIDAHLTLSRASMKRRAERGETIEAAFEHATFRTYLDSGFASLFQVAQGGTPVASDLVVRIGDAAWYLSGGTSPDGMKLGASHLLMTEVIRNLQEDGCRTLNLGFTETEALARFKTGFGGEAVRVTRIFADWGSVGGRALRWAARTVRRR